MYLSIYYFCRYLDLCFISTATSPDAGFGKHHYLSRNSGYIPVNLRKKYFSNEYRFTECHHSLIKTSPGKTTYSEWIHTKIDETGLNLPSQYSDWYGMDALELSILNYYY